MTVPTPAGGHFPYVRVAGRCDVCGCQSAELRYVKTRDAVPASATKPYGLVAAAYEQPTLHLNVTSEQPLGLRAPLRGAGRQRHPRVHKRWPVSVAARCPAQTHRNPVLRVQQGDDLEPLPEERGG